VRRFGRQNFRRFKTNDAATFNGCFSKTSAIKFSPNEIFLPGRKRRAGRANDFPSLRLDFTNRKSSTRAPVSVTPKARGENSLIVIENDDDAAFKTAENYKMFVRNFYQRG